MPEQTDAKILVSEEEQYEIPADFGRFVDIEKYKNMCANHTPPPGIYSFEPMNLDELAKILSSTIVKDRTTKLITFMVNLLTYTDQEQTGILYQSGTSTGKSYNALEVTTGYFPEQDIIKKDYVSPTAFFHQNTTMCIRTDYDEFYPILTRKSYIAKMMETWNEEHPKPESGVREWRQQQRAAKAAYKEEWNGLDKTWFWDLSRKILLFKDMPHDLVLQNLRSLISKDERIFEAGITDKNTSGQHSTKNITLRGFCTFLFISASYSQDEQERSRFLLMSPDIEEEKTRKGIEMAIERTCNRPSFKERIEKNEQRQKLRERVEAIRDAHINDVVFLDDLQNHISTRIFEEHEDLQPRLMRDVPRMIALMKAHALLNFNHRERKDDSIIVATEEDIEAGFNLYRPIAEANEKGVPPQIYDFYEQILKPAIQERIDEGKTAGLTRREFTKLWYDNFQELIGYKRRRQIIWLMDNAGLASEKTDPNDGRRKIIYIPGIGVQAAHTQETEEEPVETLQDSIQDEMLSEHLSSITTVANDGIVTDDQLRKLFQPIDWMIKIRTKLIDAGVLQEREPGKYKLKELKA